jgi:hypothetical protein
LLEANVVYLNENEIILRHDKENTGTGGEPFVYNIKTGVVTVNAIGEIDGAEFIRYAEKLKRMRITTGIDADPDKAMVEGAPRLYMGTVEIEQAGIEMAWRNLPNRYPEAQRESITSRIPIARKALESDKE